MIVEWIAMEAQEPKIANCLGCYELKRRRRITREDVSYCIQRAMSIDHNWVWITRAQVLSCWVDDKQTDNPVDLKGQRLDVFVLAEFRKYDFPSKDNGVFDWGTFTSGSSPGPV
jgi:hypothetical protein